MPGWICEYEISLKNRPTHSRDIHQWLNEQFGYTNYAMSAGRWRYFCRDEFKWPGGPRILIVRFRDRADAMLFKLTWL